MWWFRGGKWEVQTVTETWDEEYLAVLPTPPRDVRHIWLKDRLDERQAARSFLDDPAGWQERIGLPLSLIRYWAKPQHAVELLREMERIHANFAAELQQVPLVHCEVSRRDALIAELLRLLQLYGPLRPLEGVVDLSAYGIATPEGKPSGSVNLQDFSEELAFFAPLYGKVKDENADRSALALEMQIESRDDVRDVRVEVGVFNDEVRFEAKPVTLRALLWETLFDLHDRPPANCRFCHKPFRRVPHRGRPFAYCPEHRATRYRTAAYELRTALRRDRV